MNLSPIESAVDTLKAAIASVEGAKSNRCSELFELVRFHCDKANDAANEQDEPKLQYHSGLAEAYRHCLYMLRDGVQLPDCG